MEIGNVHGTPLGRLSPESDGPREADEGVGGNGHGKQLFSIDCLLQNRILFFKSVPILSVASYHQSANILCGKGHKLRLGPLTYFSWSAW